VQSRNQAEKQERLHRKEVKRMTKTISDLRNSAEQTDAKLCALTSSSALDAQSILRLKELNECLTTCNQKWVLEGSRLRKDNQRLRGDNQRLRGERDRARALSSRIATPCTSTYETSSSPPLTPRTPGHYDLDE
jgi:hypothetical protein